MGSMEESPRCKLRVRMRRSSLEKRVGRAKVCIVLLSVILFDQRAYDQLGIDDLLGTHDEDYSDRCTARRGINRVAIGQRFRWIWRSM